MDEPILANRLLAGLAPQGFFAPDVQVNLVTTDSLGGMSRVHLWRHFPARSSTGHDFAAAALEKAPWLWC